MKKYQILSAVAITMALTACQREEIWNNGTALDKDVFGFSVEKTVSTRASIEDAAAPVKFELGNSGFFMTETVTELDYADPSTKGTPIYTENIDKYYSSINVVGYKVGGEDVFVPDAAFDYLHAKDGRKVYGHHYGSDIWPAEGESQELYFYLRTPVDYITSTTSNLTYGTSDGSIEFDYTSKYKGSQQQDMLFTSRTLTKDEYFTDPNYQSQDGAPVTFYHALTGVKFRVGSANESTTKTIITGVTFSGLKDKGHCKVTPTNGQVSKQNVVWTNLSTDLGTFSQGFDNPAYSDLDTLGGDKPIDNGIDLTGNENFTGTSLVSAASDRQLNDGDGSLTFWFIPQVVDTNVTMTVTFRVKTPDTPSGTEINHTIKIGEILAAASAAVDTDNDGVNDGVFWQPGQLRTYTLDPKDVDVDIFDEMSNYKKSNFHITNTGNVDEYVRVMLMGNWYGWLPGEDPATDEPNIMVGYKYGTEAEATAAGGNFDDMVENWFFRSAPFGNGFDDSFKMGVPSGTNKWIRGTGSYYYYPDIIGAGEKLSSSEALFKTYTLDPAWVPTIWIPVGGTRQQAQGVHLVFECAVQAISAKKPNGSDYANCWEAWSAATGVTIEPK